MDEKYAITAIIGILSISSICSHLLFLVRIWKVQNANLFKCKFNQVSRKYRNTSKRNVGNLTITFLWVNSIAQLLFLVIVAPCEMKWLITARWDFGMFLCKLFKSWKSVCSGYIERVIQNVSCLILGISIMTTLLMTGDRVYGVLSYELKNQNICLKQELDFYYRLFRAWFPCFIILVTPENIHEFFKFMGCHSVFLTHYRPLNRNRNCQSKSYRNFHLFIIFTFGFLVGAPRCSCSYLNLAVQC